jgi:predicted DCC family thiol-disulfide oxidoreductase YuxK
MGSDPFTQKPIRKPLLFGTPHRNWSCGDRNAVAGSVLQMVDALMEIKYPLLLYDGVCGFCNRTVQFVLKNDHKGTVHFAPLQSGLSMAFLARHPETKGIDSIIFVEKDDEHGESVYVYSSAIIRLARYLRFPWNLLRIGSLCPALVRDALYRLFARYRYRLFGRYDVCMIPPVSVRSRFLDLPDGNSPSQV